MSKLTDVRRGGGLINYPNIIMSAANSKGLGEGGCFEILSADATVLST